MRAIRAGRMPMKNRPMGKRNKAFLVWVAVFVALGVIVYFTTRT